LPHGKALAAVLVAVAFGGVIAVRGWRAAARGGPRVAPSPLPEPAAPGPRPYGRALLAVLIALGIGTAVTASGWRSLVQDGVAAPAAAALDTSAAPAAALASPPAVSFVLPEATPTPVPRPSLAVPVDSFRRLPLEDLSPEAANLAGGLDVPLGIAVVVPERGVVYVQNGGQHFYMASVAKVPIMLALMDKSIREGRALSSGELRLVENMITHSDNDAAITLWGEIGGAAGLGDYLSAAGVDGIRPDDRWGESAATAPAVALLLEKLVAGDLLDGPSRAIAMDLMTRVETDQRWGVTAGAASPFGRATVGVKNGWYPADDGWWLNSAGFVLAAGGPSYTMAVLSADQPTFAGGVWTIERIARLINAELHG
jgi:beta-lactamase class A